MAVKIESYNDRLKHGKQMNKKIMDKYNGFTG